jgi:uncharacterized protein with FMN-binding domain
VRRLTGLGLTVASCATIAAAWRIGATTHPATESGGAQVLTPAAPASSTPAASSSPSSTATSHHAGSTSSRSRSSSTSSPSAPQVVNGAVVSTQYGDVQVRIVVTGGRLTDVTALRLTDSSGRSVSISAYAAPILRREALAAGSAHIDSVSGASYTSQGYIASLQSALDAARAAG